MASIGTLLPVVPSRQQQLILSPNSGFGFVKHEQICLKLSLVPFKNVSWTSPSQRDSRRKLRLRIVGAVAIADETPARMDVNSLKTNLLAVVAGLDRGLSAGEADVRLVDSVAGQLEAGGSGINLAEDLDMLQGRWRLIYSSAFASGSLGGRRPGPPVGRLPLTLGQVYQRIEVVAKELDNIVELRIATPWPLPRLELTATLAHAFELTGDTDIKITLEKTSAKLGGGLSQIPPFTLPQLPSFLRPSPGLRSGEFQITYLDDNMRISRGDRGELRVFLLS